jgi:hypothetical protein
LKVGEWKAVVRGAWFGRARACRRERPALFVHVGALPSPDWCGVEGVTVVAAADATRTPERQAHPQVKHQAQRPRASTPEALALEALTAAGWTRRELAARVAAVTGGVPASVERTLRRAAEGAELRDARVAEVLATLAREVFDEVHVLRV